METSTSSSEQRVLITDPLLNIDHAAEYLAIPKATLYTWRTRRAGFGPRAVKFGGSLRYRKSDLDAWIAEHLESVEVASEVLPSARGTAPSPQRGESLSRGRRRRP